MNTGYIDTIYNVSRTPFTSYPPKLADEISKRCSLITSSSLLDLGCGRGEMGSLLINSVSQSPVVIKSLLFLGF